MSEFADSVQDLVHEPTQVHDGVVDLTVAEVYEVTEPGRIDFGGDELEPAATVALGTERRYVSDDYGWWELPAGRYLIEHNEALAPPAGQRLVVQTRGALLERGAFHPTLQVRELGRVPLSVAGAGVRIKENARVSTVVGRTSD